MLMTRQLAMQIETILQPHYNEAKGDRSLADTAQRLIREPKIALIVPVAQVYA